MGPVLSLLLVLVLVPVVQLLLLLTAWAVAVPSLPSAQAHRRALLLAWVVTLRLLAVGPVDWDDPREACQGEAHLHAAHAAPLAAAAASAAAAGFRA
jgi:hypothetical protein